MIQLLAYLDAGTGSMILQAIIGGFAGLVVVSKVLWQAIRPRLGLHREDEVAAE